MIYLKEHLLSLYFPAEFLFTFVKHLTKQVEMINIDTQFINLFIRSYSKS